MLKNGGFVRKKRKLALYGAVEVGKAPLVITTGSIACMLCYKILFYTVPERVVTLEAAPPKMGGFSSFA
ncbi:ATP-binding protein [Anaerovorax odorimutans]|uniref:ATP-binding protein n=1 Tax=Anaerovorax odorimutans TaxID=109327 RepID=A0ABT1RUI5_9FIRM|nr:ATP-binding protein [Anaerovorax odorimutans]MCQ4638516.1 ATP-binding protein [Anaerovorax odorimutans]